MTFLPSIVCWTGGSTFWVSTSIGSFSTGGLSDFCYCVNVSSGSVWHGKWSEKSENWIKLRVLRRYLAASGSEVEGFSSSAVLEASVVSTEISSFWGSADEGLVGANLNAWDNSSAPRADWDAMVDNYEETELEVQYQFEKKMDCLPEKLMVSFCRVFS